MSQSFGIGEIIHCHKFYIFVFVSGSKHKPANSSKPVNGNFYWHIILLRYKKLLIKRFLLSICFVVPTMKTARYIEYLGVSKQMLHQQLFYRYLKYLPLYIHAVL